MRVCFLSATLLLVALCLVAAKEQPDMAPTTASPMSVDVLKAKALEGLSSMGFGLVSYLAKQYIPLLQDNTSKEIMEKLDEIIAELAVIQQGLDEIEKFLDQISVQQFLIPANEHKSALTAMHDEMMVFINTSVNLSKEQWQANLAVLKNKIDATAFKEAQQLYDLLVGNAATQSLFAAMQSYLLSVDSTIVQEYVSMRQVGYLYWSAFQEASDLFDFLSENGTNLYYVELGKKMLGFVQNSDEFLTKKLLDIPALTLVRDMLDNVPDGYQIDYSNMYNLTRAYAPKIVQTKVVPKGWRYRGGNSFASGYCSAMSCLTVENWPDSIRPYEFMMLDNTAIYMNWTELARCSDPPNPPGFVFSWYAGYSCLAPLTVSREYHNDPVWIHLYRVSASTIVFRFNDMMSAFYQHQNAFRFYCVGDAGKQNIQMYSTVAEAKKHDNCKWEIF
jgi:hypothetical protein